MGKRTNFCIIEGCAERVHGRCLCRRHYNLERVHGDLSKYPRTPNASNSLTVEEDIMRFGFLVTASGCHEWQGPLDANGYGILARGRTQIKVHRYTAARELARELLPTEFVRHSCDNPPCCNPVHLKVGTHKQNMRDMVLRERSAVGEQHGLSKVTMDHVREILRRSASGESKVSIARDMPIGASAVAMIARGERWSSAIHREDLSPTTSDTRTSD